MRKPNNFSVTRIPCSCGYLRRGAQDPALPIRFDAELNEYSFEHSLGRNKKISIIIYHCPLCGGVASESKRAEHLSVVTDREVKRLQAMSEGLKSVGDIENRLGKADEVRRYRAVSGFHNIRPHSGTRETKSFCVLTYARLSHTAYVQFEVYSNGEILTTIRAKPRDRSLRPTISTKKRQRNKRGPE